MHHLGYHDPVLVIASILIAGFASFVALDLATRLRTASGPARYWWFAMAAVAMGGGIWSMHFVAMLAFSLPGTAISYDSALTLISLALPIAVTAFGFLIVSRDFGMRALLVSGVVMGLGIVGMHYTGMPAMRFDGTLTYEPLFVALSVAIAIVAATAALWLAFQTTSAGQRVLAAMVMGFAISGMHYTAMAGSTFTVSPGARLVEQGNAPLAIWVIAATLVILLLGLAAAFVDRSYVSRVQRDAEALRASEQRFRLLVQGVRDYAIYMLDPQGNIAAWNPGAERIKGYGADEVIGTNFSRFYGPEDIAAGKPQSALAMAAETGTSAEEGWRLRKDGTRFWASTVLNAIRNEEGELVGFAKITRDETERRTARLALEQAQEALAQSQKMEAIGQLTGGVAHDFNNLLMIVLGNLAAAKTVIDKGDAITDRLRRAVESAHHGAQRAATLTQRLLAFSRQQPLNPKAIDINIAIKEATPLLHRALGEDRPLEVVTAAKAWNAEVDPAQFEVALLNLALNARDAMPQGGKLTVECANAYVDEAYGARHSLRPGQYVVVSVSDTGVGMSEEVMRRAFEPFFTTKPTGQGTGLGLSQVFGFTKQSGGHVNIYSEVGHGTTVKMVFPARQSGRRAIRGHNAGCRGARRRWRVHSRGRGRRRCARLHRPDAARPQLPHRQGGKRGARARLCRVTPRGRSAHHRRGDAGHERPSARRSGRKGPARDQDHLHDRLFAQRHRAPRPPRSRRRAVAEAVHPRRARRAGALRAGEAVTPLVMPGRDSKVTCAKRRLP